MNGHCSRFIKLYGTVIIKDILNICMHPVFNIIYLEIYFTSVMELGECMN